MKSQAIAAAAGILLAGAGMAMAQTTVGKGPTTGNDTATAAPMAQGNNNTVAATGNGNQAVATTSASASNPAKGANSFTMGEARSRIEKNGFSNVSDLVKDNDGIWRGKAQKGSSAAAVWLDYKGNVGATN